MENKYIIKRPDGSFNVKIKRDAIYILDTSASTLEIARRKRDEALKRWEAVTRRKQSKKV